MKSLFEQIDMDHVINNTLDLVKIQNTAGNTIEVAEVYERLLKEAGFSVEKHEFIENNPTLIGRYQGNTESKGKTLIFNGHMDVITLQHDPPYVENGKIYGRGTCDMKGSLASILEVARVLRNSNISVDGEIIVVANSMHESPGGRGEDLLAMSETINLEADAAIVMEGATYECTIAQLGSATFNITIERNGEPSHQLYTPDSIPHPIAVLADVVQALEQANEELKEKRIEDIGHGSYFIGNVQSGSFYNQMPKYSFIEGVRRYGPNDSFEDVQKQMIEILNKVGDKHGVKIYLDIKKVRDGYRIKKEDDTIKALLDSVRKVRGIDLPLVGKKLVTDAGIFVNEMDIPTICYGPDQNRAHAEVEYVEINELKKTINVYLQFIHNYLGVEIGIQS
ncbi:M20 family metallopeptidase [Virgibacillus ihumii]|uniref:M20 family metallopeptidase n=1 Tax=Virgibacillus ihumii TaxID=2686091 RepID=UPI00157D3AE1|nr:M20 family metallopeptidase [Virgibacillus ihumii]